MPVNYNELFKRFLIKEAAPAEKGVNTAALEALKRERAREAELAAQLAATGKEAPLTHSPFEDALGGIDKSKLPSTEPPAPNFELVGTPQDKGFTLGESGPISRPPVPYKSNVIEPEVMPKGWEPNSPKSNLPAVIEDTASADKMRNQFLNDNPQLNDIQKRYEQYKNLGKVGAAGIGATVAVNALNNSGGQLPPQASIAPKVPDAVPAAPLSKFSPEDLKENESVEGNAILKMLQELKRPGASERVTVPAVTPIDFGNQPSIASLQKLQEAQNRMNEAQSLNNAARIGAAAAAGMGGNKNYFEEPLAAKGKQIAGMADQYKDQVAFEKEDPNSAQSQGYKSLAKAMGFPVSGNASAADLERQFPQLANIYNQRQAQAARRDMARENRESKHQDMLLKYAQLQDANLEKDRQKMGEVINFDKQARGNAAQIRGLAQMGDRIDTLIDGLPKLRNGDPDLSKLTPIQKNELLGTFDTMLKGKSTLGGQKELMKSADTVYSHIAQLQQYLTGNKAYTNEGGLMKSVADTVRREKGLAIEKVKDMSFEGASAFKRFKQNDAKGFYKLLDDKAQISPADYYLREKGFRGNDINRFLNEGYTVDELADLAKAGKKASQIPSKMGSRQPVRRDTPNIVPQGAAPSGKKLVKQGYNKTTNKTWLKYSDGSEEIVDGNRTIK